MTGRGCIWVDFAGVALGQVCVLNKRVHCRSLSSIYILYNHTPAAPLRPHPELCLYGLALFQFHWTEVVNRRVRAKVCVSFATVADVNERTVTSIV